MDLYCDSDDYCDSDSPASQCSSVEDVDLPFLEAEDNKGSRNVPQSTWKVIDEDNLEKAQVREHLRSVRTVQEGLPTFARSFMFVSAAIL